MTGFAPPYCGCVFLYQLVITESAYPEDMTYYTCLQRIGGNTANSNLILSQLRFLISLVGLEVSKYSRCNPALVTPVLPAPVFNMFKLFCFAPQILEVPGFHTGRSSHKASYSQAQI